MVKQLVEGPIICSLVNPHIVFKPPEATIGSCVINQVFSRGVIGKTLKEVIASRVIGGLIAVL